MARGKFNKRGGGPRLDAENAQEIELRNAKLAELEEERATRRADEEEDEEGGDAGEEKADEEKPAATSSRPKPEEEKPKGPVTTEADHKRNMAKLAEVRKRREKAEARRKAEEEAEKEAEEERKRLQKLALEESNGDEGGSSKKKSGSKSSSIPKIDKVTIKRMKPAQMKEALKARDLDIQGNAKVLQKRLLDYEAAR